jgi:hypothetical protein
LIVRLIHSRYECHFWFISTASERSEALCYASVPLNFARPVEQHTKRSVTKWFMSFCSPTEHEKGQRLFTPISFFPRFRGKMKKGDRNGSSDFDGSTYRIFEGGTFPALTHRCSSQTGENLDRPISHGCNSPFKNPDGSQTERCQSAMRDAGP